MRISPHLIFDGQCKAAFTRYREVLGGALHMLTFGDSPMADEVESRWKNRIIHATLRVGRFDLAGADVLPAEYRAPQGFAVLLSVDEPSEAERLFAALGRGGEIRFPFQKTFWSAGFGVLVDEFAVPWEVNCTQPPSV